MSTIKGDIIMFVAAVGGVLIGGIIAAYDDHSNHHDHSRYSDASLKLQIQEAEERARKKEREVESLRREVSRQYENAVDTLRVNDLLPAGSDDLDDAEVRLDALEAELKEEIEKDQDELHGIDQTIRRINEIQLSRK